MSESRKVNLLLVVGGDRIGDALIHSLGGRERIRVYRDRSVSLLRIGTLLRRGSLRISDLAGMALAEFRRPRRDVSALVDGEVRTNDDLCEAIARTGSQRVLLYRAALIVTRKTLEGSAEVLNIHCATLDGYGGLAAIRRALEEGAYRQRATLHRVTGEVDRGEVLAEEPYELRPDRSYYWNEQMAYAAGTRLAHRVVDGRLDLPSPVHAPTACARQAAGKH